MKSNNLQPVLSRFAFGLSLILFLFGPGLTKELRAQGQQTERVAVKTKVPLTQAIVDELAQYGRVNRRMWKINILDMQVPPQGVLQLAADPLVEYVERDQYAKLLGIPPLENADFNAGFSHWNLDIINVTDSALNPPCCQGPAATRVVDYDGDGVYVAVLDLGMTRNWRDYFPEERIDQVHATQFTNGNAGFVETAHGVVAVPDWRWEKDTNSHGIAVTSVIIGYRFTEFGEAIGNPKAPPFNVNGVAPRATIIPIKVCQDGDGGICSVLDLVAGIYYVARLRESGEIAAPIIISLSLGMDAPSSSAEEAIDFAIDCGVIVVDGAGNAGTAGMVWPAAYPQVISSGAIGWVREFTGDFPWPQQDVPEANSTECFIANFSSRENDNLVPGFDQQLDVVAPGVAVYGPWVSHGAASPDNFHANNFNFGNLYGNSFSGPHVAGVAALLMQKNPNLSQADVESILKVTALPVPPGVHLEPVGGQIEFFGFGNQSSWGDCPAQGGFCAEEQGSGLLQVDLALAATTPP